MHRERCGERAQTFLCSLQVYILLKLPCVPHLGNSPNTFLFSLIEASLQRLDWLKHRPLVIDSTFSPFFSRGQRCDWSPNPLIIWWFSWQPAPFWMGFKSHLMKLTQNTLGNSRYFRSSARNEDEHQTSTSYYKSLYHSLPWGYLKTSHLS